LLSEVRQGNFICLFGSTFRCEREPGSSLVQCLGTAGRPGDGGSMPDRGERIFPLACVQTGSEAHRASSTMDTGGPFPGAKARPGSDADYSPPSIAEVENE
jgi:hypothetical protein